MKIRVAAVQMVSGPDVAANVEAAGRLVAQAAAQGAQVVLLPEYFCLISGNDRDKLGIQEADAGEQPGADSPLQHFLSATARQHGITLLGGTVPLKSPKINKICNSLLVYGPDGKRLARYDKIHLFGFQRGEESYDESVAIHAGRTPVVVDVPVGAAARAVARMGAPGGADENEVASIRVGLAVCYDLRFPELFRQMAPLDLMVMPAAFTYTTGQAHWSCCCGRGRWKGSAGCWPRGRAARTRVRGGAPGGIRCWWIRGARCVRCCRKARVWWWPIWTRNGRRRCARVCRRCGTG